MVHAAHKLKLQPTYLTLTTKEAAWLAGLLEGEGCFTIQTQKQFGKIEKDRSGDWTQRIHIRQYPMVALGMTDKDVMDSVASLLQTRCRGPYRVKSHPDNKPFYQLTLAGTRASELMRTLYPILHNRRRERIDQILKQCGQSLSSISAPELPLPTSGPTPDVEAQTPLQPRKWPSVIHPY